MKSQNLAVAFSLILEQTFKMKNSEQAANKALYQMGVQMGHRIADQFSSRHCSFLSLAESIKKMLGVMAEEYMGMKIELVNNNIRYQKKFHYYDLQYRINEKDLPRSIIGYCEDAAEIYPKLQPEMITAGFLAGILETMNLFGTVEPVREAEDIQFNVQVKKEIKDDD